MSRIKQAFADGKAFIAFLTAGDPHAEATIEYILKMEEAGADLIEIGIPFSDPTAEGVVIQDANIRALSAGMTTDVYKRQMWDWWRWRLEAFSCILSPGG